MEVIANKWQNRIEKRRNDGVVLNYVDSLIRQHHASLDDVASFLTSDELQGVRNILAERDKKQAEEQARWEAARLEQERKDEENRRLIAAFYEKTPVLSLATVLAHGEIQTESELFDTLSRYHIAKVECSFVANYHWERCTNIDNLIIEGAWLPSDINIDLLELPVDDECCGIGQAISDAIGRMASERAASAAAKGRLQEGTVTFDVPVRRITVDATVEVTTDETIEMSWAPDEE